MNPRKHLFEYIERCGGRPQAARALGLPYSTLCSICNGYRGISRSMAERMAKASLWQLDANHLVWVKQTIPSPQPSKQVA